MLTANNYLSAYNIIPTIVEALQTIEAQWIGSLVQGLAQERAIHLAIETVTDMEAALLTGLLCVMRAATRIL